MSIPFIYTIWENNLFSIIASFCVAFGLTYISIPRILAAARLKNLYDVPNGRASHRVNTPTLGGIGVFVGLLVSMLLFVKTQSAPYIQYFILGITIVFFIGLKDDILTITAVKKLIGQIAAVLLLIVLGDVRLTNLHGFLSIQEISYIESVFLSMFVYIVITNCVNLIDGVDGLASGLAIVTSLVLGIWFYLIGEYACTIISISLFGALIPFFKFNVFGKKNKLFMGDTGSLIIGFIIAFLLIQFNEANVNLDSIYAVKASPAVSIGLFFIPLYDTLQVITLRIKGRRSLFKADKSHLHHFILRLNNSHLKTTIILVSVNILVIIIAFQFQFLGIIKLTTLLLIIGLILSSILRYSSRNK